MSQVNSIHENIKQFSQILKDIQKFIKSDSLVHHALN